jgi:4-hydroxy-tetrahydrodipicolinate reductase
MKIALHGATGRMGQSVVRVVNERREHQIVGAVAAPDDPNQGRDVGEVAGVGVLGVAVTADVGAALLGADIVIDFSVVAAVAPLINAAVRAKLPVVSGTTGIGTTGEAVIDDAARSIPVLWAANMSLGIEVLATLAREATELLGEDFDVEIVETHHKHKVDAPSGTALRLAAAVREARANLALKHGREGAAGPRKSNELAVLALRGGDVIGDHTIHLLGPGERMEITHRVTQRDLLARGAVKAAAWLVGKPPRRYALRDLLESPKSARK